jgi:EAL domain-containing protein (putative c-di-GMP-specific phosphodiesterase class I)
VVPITLLGIMLGWRAGLLAAGAASGAFLVWAATEGHIGTLDYADQPLTFFLLGGISGFFAHGALGDYSLKRAIALGKLRKALADDEILLRYQPIVAARDGRAVAIEALARWDDPDRGIVGPDAFIPLAESDRRTILRLTIHTLELAARDLGERVEDRDVAVVVNVSPVALEEPEIAEQVAGVIERTGVSPGRLGIEVTESAFAGEQSPVADALAEIRGLGLNSIAIDDFGVGHSSIERLGRLPIDTLKIDQRLVDDSPNGRVRPVVEGIIRLAHTLELSVIAEGVEDGGTAEALVDWGCDAIQGHHVCKPLPPDELAGWLERRAATCAD